MVAPDETSFSATKRSGRTWASVVAGGGGDIEVGDVSSVKGFDAKYQYLAGKSGCCDVDGADDASLSDSGEERIVVDEAVKAIEKDGVGKFEIVNVDVEDENLVLVSEDETKEEKSLISDKVDDDDTIDQVVEEEAVKLRNFIVDLLAKESLHVDVVVDKTKLNIQETDDLTAADDPVADIVSTRDFSAEGSSGEGVVGVDGSGSGEETEEMIVGSSKSGEQFLVGLEKVYSGIDAHTDQKNIPSHHVDRIDGQIVTDSGEEVDINDEGEEKIFDTEALAAFLKASTGGSSDGGDFTITSQDVIKLFSMEPPAGLGSSSGLLQSATPLPNRSNTFPSLTVAMGGESESNLSEEEKQKLEKLQCV